MLLTPIEITLINKLGEGKYTLSEASVKTGMNKDAVLKAAHLLQEKGIAEVVTKVKRRYFLTNEGKNYLRTGLPEERLANILKDRGGSESITELQKIMGKKEFNIALGWLKKMGAIKIEKGIVYLKFEPSFEIKKQLEAVEKGEECKNLKTLIKRKLIDFNEEKEIFIIIKEKEKAGEFKEYIADLTPEIIKSEEWKTKEFLKYDINIPSKDVFAAKIHPYERIIRECRKIFLDMGFTEIKGNYIQPSFWNFDALFQPQDHPARDMQDTFYLDKYVELKEELEKGFVEKVKETHENGWLTGSTGWGGKWSVQKAKQLVLRTHTTAITIHYLAMNPEPPVKAFCIDRVYRRETIDATHLPEFDQLEGVVLDKDVGFRHLLGMLKEFFAKMGFNVRFRPGYFPYTEPSVEPEVYVEGLGWVELGGAGVFREEVTEPLGIKGRVLAWGLGIGRLAMLRLGMKDLRRLYVPDINWLRNFPVVRK